MRKKFLQLATAFLTLISLGVGADELSGYVSKCESELGFAASDVPSFDCNNAAFFKGTRDSNSANPVNDYVGHAQVNAEVDLVFACRWLDTHNLATDTFATAISIELLIHNRRTGGTCFFAAKDPNPLPQTDPQISTAIVSPTDPNASSYWMQPIVLENTKFVNSGVGGSLRCVGCHVAGPYIASPEIAPFLAQFGLLNDGHDTNAERYYAVLPLGKKVLNVALPSAFTLWNGIIHNNNSTTTCASGCHSIGLNSTTTSLLGFGASEFIIPSLQQDRTDVKNAGLMPADADPYSDYRWVNMHTTLNDPSGDFETLGLLSALYPKFACSGSSPTSLEAHVVDSSVIISTQDLPDKLNLFNLQDGLVCLNNDQPGGRQCQDYQTRYICNGRLTAWQNNDHPYVSGDRELRSSFQNLCLSPTAIQARYRKTPTTWAYADGPADRLAEFDSQGLVCYNSNQTNGQCSNYVVRFICP